MPVYNVRNFEIVDKTRYKNGDLFLNDQNDVGMMVNNKIEKMIFESSMKGYIKKTEVTKMIDSALKKVTSNG